MKNVKRAALCFFFLFISVSSLKPKNTVKPANQDGDLWGSIAAPAPKTTSKPLSAKAAGTIEDDDDPWGSIAAPAPKTTTRPLHVKSATTSKDDDPWAAIAAPPPTTKAKPLVAGRGRGAKPSAAKLGAQKINRASSMGL